jgi:hypothetical protein
MKPGLLINFYKIFDVYKPANICEVGTHNAKTAVQMCEYLLAKGLDVHYTGYDMFDLADDVGFHKAEHNGKGPGSLDRATRMLEHVKKRYPKFKYKLIKGNTNDTLITSEKYDFAFIDGGHSYETVKHDYEMLKETPIIIFDDYQIKGVRDFVDELEGVQELLHDGPKRRQAVRFDKFDPLHGHELVAIFKESV